MEQLLGGACVAFGVYTIYARIAKPESFRKLDAMKKFYGATLGTAVHVVGYTVVPIAAGVLLLLGVIDL